MTPKWQAYLSKRASLDHYPLVLNTLVELPEAVIVIPALAEAENLPHTLDSLSQCSLELLVKTLIIIVVNNRESEYVDTVALENNQRTIDWLRSTPSPTLRLNFIDASSPGQELKLKEGVGAARKIGMDRAFACLMESDIATPLIVCLDADTLVEPNYLDAVYRYAKRSDAWAGVIDYAHPLPDDADKQSAIVSYELFLRYQHLGLHWAQSPYAFHTIGSTIVCTPKAYAAVSGMNRRAAGEDFYFLQQLAKTGTVGCIHDTTVYPSARISWRVPFGTGKRVGRFMEGTHEEYRIYACASYGVLKEWLSAVEANLDASAEALLVQADAIHAALRSFLLEHSFDEHWPKLQQQASSLKQLRAQFHRWFDGFKTLKMIHHLRDHAFPDEPTFRAYSTLCEVMYSPEIPSVEAEGVVPMPTQVEYLEQLRLVMRTMGD